MATIEGFQTIGVDSLTPHIGAEIGGVDLSQPLSNEQFSEIYQAWLDWKVLVFRDQHINQEQHKALLADRNSRKFYIDGAQKIWLRFWIYSNSNPRPYDVHNCDSTLDIYYRLDGGKWKQQTSSCGDNVSDRKPGDFKNVVVSFDAEGAKTFEVAFAFTLQNNPVERRNALFLIDDAMLIAEY